MSTASQAAPAHLQRTEYRDIDMATADQGEARGAVEVGSTRERGDRTLRGIDQIGIEFVLTRPRADAEEAVLRMEEDLGVGPEVSGDQVGNADAQLHDLASVKLPCRPR